MACKPMKTLSANINIGNMPTFYTPITYLSSATIMYTKFHEATNSTDKLARKVPGTTGERAENGKVTYKSENRAFIETPDHKTVISLNWIGTPKKWVLTSYDKP